MTPEESAFEGGTGYQRSSSAGMGDAGLQEPAAWPGPAEEATSRGWWPTLLVGSGSLLGILGAVFLARRRSKRSGLMAALPSQIADAGEQMMRARGNSGGSPLRTLVAIVVFALAGWGIRRTVAHQMAHQA